MEISEYKPQQYIYSQRPVTVFHMPEMLSRSNLCCVFKHTADIAPATGCKDDFEADCPVHSC